MTDCPEAATPRKFCKPWLAMSARRLVAARTDRGGEFDALAEGEYGTGASAPSAHREAEIAGLASLIRGFSGAILATALN